MPQLSAPLSFFLLLLLLPHFFFLFPPTYFRHRRRFLRCRRFVGCRSIRSISPSPRFPSRASKAKLNRICYRICLTLRRNEPGGNELFPQFNRPLFYSLFLSLSLSFLFSFSLFFLYDAIIQSRNRRIYSLDESLRFRRIIDSDGVGKRGG